MPITPFSQKIQGTSLPVLEAARIDTFQVNVGKLCNQICKHCHVDAGPKRTEIMTHDTAQLIIEALRKHPEIETLDITGGAPEMCPEFDFLVREATALGRRVIDRCNLTIFFEPGKDYLPEFLRAYRVKVVASLPCYSKDNVEKQRGEGVFDKSIAALQWLNRLGYGEADSGLELDLVYNPLGPSLPPSQAELEADYKSELREHFNIEFNRLFTITNMPISRFLADLLESGRFESYLQKLVTAFNPSTIDGLMCRSTLSVDWRGFLYDCDFNQMLELPLETSAPQHISDFDFGALRRRRIATGRHCFGCTAGAGSSCQGEVVQLRTGT